jgi:hypothetical protein
MRRAGITLLVTVLSTLSGVARAGTPEADPPVADVDAEKAVRLLREGLASKNAAVRRDAVLTHGKVHHAKVAEVALRVIEKSREELVVLSACFSVLARQRSSAAGIVPSVVKWLDGRAAEDRERMKKGDPGFRVDPRSGEPDVSSAEGGSALARLAERSEAIAEAVRCAVGLASTPVDPVKWGAFLSDPSDALVIAVLDAAGAAKSWPLLPEILALYRCYPAPSVWETGAVVDLAGTNATAKAKWMLLFGHPQKQRARPDVVKALRAALTAITGTSLADPDALEAFLRKPDVADRVAGKRVRGKQR